MKHINNVGKLLIKCLYALLFIVVVASIFRLSLLSREIPMLIQRVQLAFNSNFGKTHFIVGYDEPIADNKDNSTGFIQTKRIQCALFSPDDKIRKTLIAHIQQEKESIKIAIFTFTDSKIAQELINAHERGVFIEIVTDPTSLREQYNKIGELSNHGIPIFVYNPQTRKGRYAGIMHHKFALFGKNVENKPLLWTGSFNFTRAAHKTNRENVVILDDHALIKQYTAQFELEKKYSYKMLVNKKE